MRRRSNDRLFSMVLVVAVLMIAAVTTAQNITWWPFAGQNLFNTHSHPAEDQISPANVATLVEKWSLTTAGNVTATPTVYQGVMYVPDMGGQLWAVTADSGKVRWSRSIASYTGIAGDVSRTSPAIAGEAIILGDGWIRNNVTAGAHVFAVDRRTGGLLWLTRVHEHLTAIITSSPIVDNGVAYVGIASKEEGAVWDTGLRVLHVSRCGRGARCAHRTNTLENLHGPFEQQRQRYQFARLLQWQRRLGLVAGCRYETWTSVFRNRQQFLRAAWCLPDA